MPTLSGTARLRPWALRRVACLRATRRPAAAPPWQATGERGAPAARRCRCSWASSMRRPPPQRQRRRPGKQGSVNRRNLRVLRLLGTPLACAAARATRHQVGRRQTLRRLARGTAAGSCVRPRRERRLRWRRRRRRRRRRRVRRKASACQQWCSRPTFGPRAGRRTAVAPPLAPAPGLRITRTTTASLPRSSRPPGCAFARCCGSTRSSRRGPPRRPLW
mmetsp:Transcript_4328/g.18293  ORF Transcript_4328/g.18293 Transcript_4328/m.18293 type:complete len:219 (+) Transcript_4328:1098-1754(+)